ncbi:hypothetical protein FACS1894214_1180 [Planctomycetales bacterium]|nr:hypothetical protein FACS1894214_1180 [Planctomycetales bacterium]
MVGVRRNEQTGTFVLCPVEHFLLLQGTSGLENKDAQRLAVIAAEETEQARAFLISNVLQTIINERKEHYAEHLPQQEQLIRRGYEYREMELAAARTKHNEKAKKGNKKAAEALEAVKIQQRELFGERDNKIAALYREPELFVPGEVRFITHALVVPATTSEEQKQFDADVEKIAMQFVQAFEEANGAKVFDVHTPPLARQAGLPDNPGFDLLSRYPDGEERCIEVNGRAKNADVEMTGNEWAKACNLRNRYWLYAVFNCAESHPQLVKVQDPFYNVLVRESGSITITHSQMIKAGID